MREVEIEFLEESNHIEREYSEVLNEIRKQKKGSNVDNIIINFLISFMLINLL